LADDGGAEHEETVAQAAGLFIAGAQAVEAASQVYLVYGGSAYRVSFIRVVS
jgi:hypothetical protein